MSKRITAEEKTALEKQIIEYAERYGSFCVNTISQTFKVKWETANTSIQNLLDAGRIFVITGTKNPKVYTIWPDTSQQRVRQTMLATQKEQELSGIGSIPYARPSSPHVRASTHDDVRRTVGFVCHPTVKGREVDIEYIRAHWSGPMVVEVIKRGQMIESWKLDGQPVTGSWKVTPMSGNLSCNGRIHLPEDPDAFSVKALTKKDGSISRLNIYVHPRYIYYKASERTAVMEFRQQVQDIMDVLTVMGWEFGQIIDNGEYRQLHRAMNSVKLGMIAMQATAYEEKEGDMVHFDRSHGTPEAEVYGASEEANATVEFLANPLPVINQLGDRMGAVESAMVRMGSAVEQMGGTMTKFLEVLVQQGEILVKLAEAQGQSVQYVAPKEEDGIAYGRADL